jgi:hypothetical protein
MSKESAVKVLMEIQYEGIVTISDKEIDLTNIEMLNKISRIG